MENFISVSIPSRRAKKSVLEKMIASAGIHLNEGEPNYGVFQGEDKNIILKLELPQELNSKDSDIVAHNLSENLFDLGYDDFDIEISSDPSDETTLENTDWHTIDEAPIQIVQIGPNGEYVNFNIDKSLPSIEVKGPTGKPRRIHGTPAQLAKAQADLKKKGSQITKPIKAQGGVQGATFNKDGSINTGEPKDKEVTKKQPGSGPAPGSEEALMAIVNQYAKPGMTLADVDSMERAAVASEVQSAPDDANIFSKAFKGFMRFAKSKDWRVKFVLANAAEKMELPGLFNSRGSFIYMAEQSTDDESGNFDAGGPSSAAGTSLKDYMTLAKVGLLPASKIEKIQKAFANRPDDMKTVNAIVAAQKAATTKAPSGDLPGDGMTDVERQAKQGVDAAKAGVDSPGADAGKFDNLSQKEASQLLFDKLKQLRELMRNNPEPRSGIAENNKKILMRRLHGNHIFEDAAADKAIAELIADIELLMPKVSDANQRIAADAVRKASPYVKRHQAVSAAKPDLKKADKISSADDRVKRLNIPGNPLADFAKSGKGGLANDPDEQLAIDELQSYLGVPVTGKYDQATKDAVAKYQKENGLKVDGDAGPNTIAKMMGVDPQDLTDPNRSDAKQKSKEKSAADQRKADAKKDLKNGVAPEEEQTLENAIKFNWKKKSYYVSTTKVEKNEANNNIAWVFYKDEELKQGQKVATLGSHWEAQLEKELERRAAAGSKKAKDALEIINPEGKDDPKFAPAQTGGEADTDADVDAGIVEDIYDAVKTLTGTDEKQLFDAIGAIRDNAHYKTIARMFKKEYPNAIGGKYPTLAIWMRDDLEGWFFTADDLKKFDREMNRLGVNIKKPIPAEKVAKGETVKSGNKTVVGTGEPKDKPKDGGNPGGNQSTAKKDDSTTTDKKDDSTTTDKKDDSTTTDKKDDGGETASDDSKAKKPEKFSAEQETYMGKLAEKIMRAGDFGITTGGTDEKAIQSALSMIKTPGQYKKVDQYFKDLEDNEKGVDLDTWLRSELNMNTRDMNRYYWAELRRIKVPHNIGSNELRRLKSDMGGRVFDEKIAPFYDDKGKFLPKGKPKADAKK